VLSLLVETVRLFEIGMARHDTLARRQQHILLQCLLSVGGNQGRDATQREGWKENQRPRGGGGGGPRLCSQDEGVWGGGQDC
jgi:hypothetical protein